MAKGRMLQNRVSKSNKLASLSSDTARLLYTWMLSHLDINGNFYADPVMVNNIVFTRLKKSPSVISALLDELAESNLIIRYQIDGETYLNYPDFQEKQPKLNPYKEGTPEIPIMTEESRLTNASVTPAQVKRSKVKRSKENAQNLRQEPKEGFEEFWKAYPRKVNKPEAIQAWNKANHPPLDIILKAIQDQKQSDQWNSDNGKYIPYPSSWLNKERWNDELPGRFRTDYCAGQATSKAGGNGGGSGHVPPEYKPEPIPDVSPEEQQRNLKRLRGIIDGI